MVRQEGVAAGPSRHATPAGRGGQDAIDAALRVATVAPADSTAATSRARPAPRLGKCSQVGNKKSNVRIFHFEDSDLKSRVF